MPAFPKPTEQIDRVPLTRAEQDYVVAGNDFGWALMERVWTQAEKKESMMLSPLSVQFALGMLGNAAADKSVSDKLSAVLGYDKIENLNAYCAKLISDLPKVDTTVTLATANAIVADDFRKIDESFQTTVEQAYDAEICSMSFKDPSAVLDRVNGWCRIHTYGRIDKILEQVSPMDRVYLMNALYFNGRWAYPFDEAASKTESFRPLTGAKSRVEMMHLTTHFFYYENELFQGVRLPYGNGHYALSVFLPKKGVSLDQVIESHPSVNFGMSYPEVILSLPRFRTESNLNLLGVLADLGLPLEGYDSFYSPIYPMSVSMIRQKSFISVSETGTEAAAVTIIGLIGTTDIYAPKPEPIVFNADHSFLYTISEETSGTILFIGIYNGD